MAQYNGDLYDASDLNRRVTFQRFVGERDIIGDLQFQEDENWEDEVTVWGSVRTIGTREFYSAGQAGSEVTHNIKIRKRSWDHSPTYMRVTCQGSVYRVIAPPMDVGERGRYQLIKVAEVVR